MDKDGWAATVLNMGTQTNYMTNSYPTREEAMKMSTDELNQIKGIKETFTLTKDEYIEFMRNFYRDISTNNTDADK